jgi:hypothetical protein
MAPAVLVRAVLVLTFDTAVFWKTSGEPWLTLGCSGLLHLYRRHLDTIHLECEHLLLRFSINS